jgi:DNA-binding MarR family transcriptional regulator
MGLPPWSGRVSDGEPACKRQNQLGRRVATDSATITGIVNRLMQRGWVTSSAHAEDARLCLIELTDAGREVVEQLLPQGIAISKETLAPLSEGSRRGSSSCCAASQRTAMSRSPVELPDDTRSRHGLLFD